jgi:ABC-type enterochelin transport system ATPase subunit
MVVFKCSKRNFWTLIIQILDGNYILMKSVLNIKDLKFSMVLLIPKRRTGPTRAKPILAVSHDLTIFSDFLNFLFPMRFGISLA